MHPILRHPAFATVRDLIGDKRGLALIEFAFTLPLMLSISLVGAELTNYITVRMQVSQLALHIADNASRIGSGGQLQVKTIQEADINDLFIGANYQSGDLNLKANGRVILSSLEPMANPNKTDRYKIRWQRCFGERPYASRYDKDKTNIPGMGDPGRLVKAPDGGQTMFVELVYRYKPLVGNEIVADYLPDLDIVEHASMLVRDTRDTTVGPEGIKPTPGVTASLCKK